MESECRAKGRTKANSPLIIPKFFVKFRLVAVAVVAVERSERIGQERLTQWAVDARLHFTVSVPT